MFTQNNKVYWKMMESILNNLQNTISARKNAESEYSYVASLFKKGEDTILKKLGEECVEVVIAGKNGDVKQIVYESADLVFHLMVMLAHYDLKLEDVIKELSHREGLSGFDEKATREIPSLIGAGEK